MPNTHIIGSIKNRKWTCSLHAKNKTKNNHRFCDIAPKHITGHCKKNNPQSIFSEENGWCESQSIKTLL